jgi:hypothetical protein
VRDPGAQRPTIEVSGNREGLLTLGNFLLWISMEAGDHESLSVTELPFIRVESALRLLIIQPMDAVRGGGRVVKSDRGMQFEWQVDMDDLERVALSIINTALTPDGFMPGYFKPDVSDDSDALLIFMQQSGRSAV